MAKPPGKRPPIAGLVDLFGDEFGALAGPIVSDIKKGLSRGLDVRAAVQASLAKHQVTQKIQASVLDKMVAASAIGFGIEPKAVVDPVGIRKTFLNAHWRGDGLTLSRRIAKEGYKHQITDAIAAQMSKARSWTETAEALTNPLRKGGGPDFIKADVARNLEELAAKARSIAAGSPEDLRAFRREIAAAKRYVARLSGRGAPNQTLKAIYSDVIRAAEDLNTKALDRAMQQAVRDKARYNAERIARTEIARAYGAGEDLAQMEDVDVVAERIQLSSRHPEPDICDFHAKSDLYGMGPGVYPKDRKPPFPFHPHCTCIKTRIYVGEVEFTDKMDPEAGARYLASLPASHRQAMLGVEGAEAFARNPADWQKRLRHWDGHRPVTLPRGLKAEQFTGPPGFDALPPAQVLQEKVALVEKRIRPQRFESAAAFADDGEMVLFKDGAATSVSFTPADVAKIRGTVLTHNHPRGWGVEASDPRRGGNSFSPSDIALASKAQLKEIRAASPLYDHSMKPGPSGWSEEYFKAVILPVFQRHDAAVHAESMLAIRAGFLAIEQAEARHYHEVWTRVSAELGLIYQRERIPE